MTIPFVVQSTVVSMRAADGLILSTWHRSEGLVKGHFADPKSMQDSPHLESDQREFIMSNRMSVEMERVRCQKENPWTD